MNSNTVKKYIRDNFGLKVRVSTTPTKNPWITAWIPSDRNTGDKLIYSSAPFPEAFRQRCIRLVYPNSPTLHAQTSAGNVTGYSIAMTAREWARLIEGATVFCSLDGTQWGVRCADLNSEWFATESEAQSYANKLTGII